MSELLHGVQWYRGSSIRLERDGVVLRVDPRGVEAEDPADFVLLTHPHFDTFSEEDVARVTGPESVVIAPVSMKKQIDTADHFLRPGDMLQLGPLDVLAVPAYNPSRKFHPRESGWLGYVFTLGGVTYYHAGDTDFLESMREIRCDVAFLPCDGQYTMAPGDAARAARACGARVVVPIRWGEDDDARSGAEVLADLLPDVVTILERAA